MPTNLGALINLRHLDIEGTKLERMPPHIGKLKDRRTLSEFVLDKRTGHNIVELKELKHLCGKFRMLGLHHIDNVTDASEASIRVFGPKITLGRARTTFGPVPSQK